MKVAILGSLKSPHVIRWAISLSNRGIEVHVISMHKSRSVCKKDFKFHYLKYPKPFGYLLNILELKRVLAHLNPDIIHSFYALGYGTLGTLSGFKPHVLSVMGSDIYDDIKNPIMKRFILNNIRNADVVCSTSRIMAKQIEKISGLDENLIEYTPFGINTEVFKHGGNKENNREIIFGTVKFLEDKYGIDVLLRAYALFRSMNPQIKSKLVIVGDGSKEIILKKLAKKLGVFKYCRFEGYQPHAKIPSFLQTFDVYLALSRLDSESFGVAILEASACEVPVIVSNVGGLPEVVLHNVTGYVVDKENPGAACKAMTKLALNSELRLLLGQKARERVISDYDWANSIKKMLKIYQRLV
ncbi:MAG: glycosyltransferase [Balneolaceae bacterium]|nr:glycosyltransferase [Balneolaceae bacterium]